jgi:tetratricopeptide (TPR) repeat protein
MGRDKLLEFAKGADINTDDGAQLEFSAPKNLRRPTTELNRRLMAPFVEESPPWLKSASLPVPAAMHHLYMAQAYAASQAFNRALKEVDRAIALDPSNPKFFLLRLKVLLEQDKSADGAKAAFAALALDKGTASEILAMSDEFYLPEAKAVYGKIIEMGSREVLPYLGLGNIALHGGDKEEAEKWFAKAKELQPDHPAVLLATGRLAAAKGQYEQYEQAKTLLERSRAKGEESATIYSELGAVYMHLEAWDKAAENYEHALRMRRRRNDLRLSLARTYAQLGRRGEAEQKYREVLAFSPEDTDALKGLQQLGKRF